MCLSVRFVHVMESRFLTVMLLSSFAVNSSHLGVTEWDDVVVAREDMPTTLVCTDTTVSGVVTINWKVKSLGADEWKLVLAARADRVFGGALKPSMRLTDPNFHDTGVFSLFLRAKLEDGGLYSCLIRLQDGQLKERKILLAILKVSVVPAAPVPRYSTLRLIASVNPNYAATKISWAAPGGISIRSETWPSTGTVAKLPEVQSSDSGVYVCTVHLWTNSSSSSFTFDVNVTVDAHKLASFTNITHDRDISATQAQTPCRLTCPSVQGDYVVLRWQPPEVKKDTSMRIVHQYDRWRGSTVLTEQRKRLQLAGPPYNADTGSFSYLLTPEIKDGGLYDCTVYLNDVAISKMTLLSVLKVRTRRLPSKLELLCQYSKRIQVQSASWKYQNKSRQLQMSSNGPGSITTTVSLPITRDTAGNYTCTLTLKNGQTIWATQAVTLPSQELVSATTSSLLPSLSALLLLVPLVAAGVLLWRQKHISDRGIQQSLSVHSGEVENIYENPEDIRQAPPQGSVYMDLKPRGEDDVYKELERYEQCHN